MRKLKLQIDQLAVDSFTTTPEMMSSAGTVHARSPHLTGWLTCEGSTCVGSCFGEVSCIGGPTCNGACPSGNGTCGSLCTAQCPARTYEYDTCNIYECGAPTVGCGGGTDNTGCGQATCGNGTCAVNTCPVDTV